MPSNRPVSGMQLRAPLASAPEARLVTGLLVFIVAAMLNASFAEVWRFGLNFPIRTPVSVALLMCVVVLALVERTAIIESRIGWAILVVWGMFLVWMTISRIGLDLDVQHMARRFVGRHFTSFAAFLAIVLYARTRRRLEVVFWVFVGMVSLSCLVAVFQWLGQGWAWRLRLIFQTGAAVTDMYGLDNELASGSLVCGLFTAPFIFGFYVAAAGPMILPVLLKPQRRAPALTALGIIMLGTMLLQERSALLAFAVCLVLFALTAWRFGKGGVARTVLALLVTGGLAYGVFSWSTGQAERSGQYKLERFYDTRGGGRLEAWAMVLDNARDAWLFGTPGEVYKKKIDAGTAKAPHNLFFNSLLYYGAVGLLLTIVMISLYVFLALSVWRGALRTRDYVALGCVLGLLGYLINCQFHNANFLNGDYVNWWLVAFLLAAYQIQKRDAVTQPRVVRIRRRLITNGNNGGN